MFCGHHFPPQRLCLIPGVLLLIGLYAGQGIAAEQSDQSRSDDLWRHAVLYQNSETLVRSLALSGRAQGDYAWYDADEGDYDDLRWRRFRFGFTSELGQQLTLRLEGDFDLNNSPGDLYNRLTDAHLDWQVTPDATVKVLKHSAGFTLDGATSSKKLLTPERNNLTNNLWFTAEYFTGLSFSSGAGQRWKYRAGLFSSDDSDEIGFSDGGYFILLTGSLDLSADLALDTAKTTLHYVYNDKDPEANTRDFDHVVSLSTDWRQGALGLRTDFSAGRGYYRQSDLLGVVLMPYYAITERWQLVARYTFIDSDDEHGIRLNRYDSSISDGRGDRYNEYFGGINLFLYGHKLKWQTGLRYTSMNDHAGNSGDYDSWGLITGLRVSW